VTERYAKAVALLNRGTAEKTARVFDLRGTNHTQNHTQERLITVGGGMLRIKEEGQGILCRI